MKEARGFTPDEKNKRLSDITKNFTKCKEYGDDKLGLAMQTSPGSRQILRRRPWVGVVQGRGRALPVMNARPPIKKTAGNLWLGTPRNKRNAKKWRTRRIQRVTKKRR